jgi:hypothetical protein
LLRASFLAPALLLALAFLLACTSTTTTTPTPTQLTPVPIPSEAATVVDAALNDAATHLGLTKDQLRVDQVESREWPDSSLGCPQPGQLYSQIVTPGYLIILSSSDGRQLEYHTDTRSHLTLCHES